jgi:hypothetical protein
LAVGQIVAESRIKKIALSNEPFTSQDGPLDLVETTCLGEEEEKLYEDCVFAQIGGMGESPGGMRQ